jgi:hypothetical protein
MMRLNHGYLVGDYQGTFIGSAVYMIVSELLLIIYNTNNFITNSMMITVEFIIEFKRGHI